MIFCSSLPQLFVGRLLFYCIVCVCLHSGFQRVVLLYVFTFLAPCCDVRISACKLCSVRPYPQLFVGSLISYLYHLCMFAYNGVQHILTISVPLWGSYKKDMGSFPVFSGVCVTAPGFIPGVSCSLCGSTWAHPWCLVVRVVAPGVIPDVEWSMCDSTWDHPWCLVESVWQHLGLSLVFSGVCVAAPGPIPGV